jgi:hypothetical protein
MITPAELIEIRAVLESVSSRISEALATWPPDIELAAYLAHELAYASHVADALEADARRRHDRT